MDSHSGLSLLLLLALITLLVYFLFNFSLGKQHDPREPPCIPKPIPYIGHLLGLIRHGTRYYAQVSSRYPLEIYTLRMPHVNMYIVNSLDLVSAVQRNWKTMSFAPFVATFLKRLCLPSKAASEIVDMNLFAEDGAWGLFTDTHNAMHQALAPGPHLDEMISSILESVCTYLERLLGDHGEATVDLYDWVRHMVTLASTDAVYGPQNPFQEMEVREAFWAVESKFPLLLVGVATNLLAPKAYRGRDRIFEAFKVYYANCGHEEGSSLAKARYTAAKKNGTPLEDIARFELSGLFGMLINTVPCTFWVILDLFSDPQLLQSVREEILTAVVTSTSENATITHDLNIAQMKETCFLLPSLFQETLRTRSTGSSIRHVREDVLLADRYLLKKGSMVQMPFSVIHHNEDIWGKTAKEFNPRRFIKTTSSFNVKQKTAIKPGTFRGFGGGTTLCPGRHIATAEITYVVALLAVRFEITPLAAQGWGEPKQAKNHGATSVLPPEKDFRVTIKRRSGTEMSQWKINMKGLKAEFVPVD